MRETVLVVDDDDDIRMLYRSMLTKRGYRVLEARSLEDAFGKLAHDPHVIVLDYELPDGNSSALLDALSRDPEAPPVVLCSSSMYGKRVANRYHIAALGKFELSAVVDEVERVLRLNARPRLSRSSRSSGENRLSIE